MSRNISFTEAEYVNREFTAFNEELKRRLADLQSFLSSRYVSDLKFTPRFSEKFYIEIMEEMLPGKTYGMNADQPFTLWALGKCARELLDKPKRKWFR